MPASRPRHLAAAAVAALLVGVSTSTTCMVAAAPNPIPSDSPARHYPVSLADAAANFNSTSAELFINSTGTEPVKASSTSIPTLTLPASLPTSNRSLSGNYLSFSVEPAFYEEFFGTNGAPNNFSMQLFQHIRDRTGVPPILRLGGNTMDSTTFDPASNGTATRTSGSKGQVWRTTYGPAFYQSWNNNFPPDWKFVVTLDLKNGSLESAKQEAVAAVRYAGPQRIAYFELGNEPNLYQGSAAFSSTQDYVKTWLNWTAEIDAAVNAQVASITNASPLPSRRWWAASNVAGYDNPAIGPSDIWHAGIDKKQQLADYSIHSYQFNACSQGGTESATLANMLDMQTLSSFLQSRLSSADKALFQQTDATWILGEGNSVACEGKPGVSDSFGQALYLTALLLTYATLGAARSYIHSGASLLTGLESSKTLNQGTTDGSPSFSTYNHFYPTDSSARGEKRANPGYLSQLLLAEAIGTSGKAQTVSLDVPSSFSKSEVYINAIYDSGVSGGGNDTLPARLVIVNSKPYMSNQKTAPGSIKLNISALFPHSSTGSQQQQQSMNFTVKRLTAPRTDTTDAGLATWAGQSFKYGTPNGTLSIEVVQNGTVALRDSEALLVFLKGNAFGDGSGGEQVVGDGPSGLPPSEAVASHAAPLFARKGTAGLAIAAQAVMLSVGITYGAALLC